MAFIGPIEVSFRANFRKTSCSKIIVGGSIRVSVQHGCKNFCTHNGRVAIRASISDSEVVDETLAS